MKVVVLGATGFIGAHLMASLANRNVNVTGLSSKTGNLMSPQGLAKVAQFCDAQTSVVFCSGIGRNGNPSGETLQQNVDMAGGFLQAAGGRQLRSLIYLSSVDVYGLPPASLPVTESTPIQPSCTHGRAKLASENLLRVGLDCPMTTLRLPGVYGPGDRCQSLVGRFTKRLKEGRQITLSGTGSVKRDFVDVGTVTRAVGSFLDEPDAGVANVVAGQSRTMAEWVELIAEKLGTSAKIQYINSDDGRDFDLNFDSTKLHDLVPHLAGTTIETAVSHYIDSMFSHRLQAA